MLRWLLFKGHSFVILKSFLIQLSLVCSLSAALTYDVALQKTLIQSPAILASLDEIEEREGDKIQSGLYINPIVSYSVENVFGNKHWRGWNSAEQRLEFSQAIRVGGEREYRLSMAEYRLLAKQFQHSYLEMQVAGALKKAFLEVIVAQERLNLANEQMSTSQAIRRTVLLKAENGKANPLEINRALMGAANIELILKRATTDLAVARQQLARFWGDLSPDFDEVEYPFYDFECPSSLEECLSDHAAHPLLLKTQFDQLAAADEIKLAKAQAIPDVIVTAGFKTLRNTNERGMIIGIAIPLPFFDRKQGEIYRTEAQNCRIYNIYFEQQIALEVRLAALHKEAMRAYTELVQLKTVILEIAEDSFEIVQEGYSAGKFEYLDLLEAQKTLFESQERCIQALFKFFEIQTDIEYPTF